MLNAQSDARLLDTWRRSHDREAMDQLIRRHIHFVYGSARRILRGDGSAAEDVTQAVFMLLIQKSPRLPSDAALAVWLHRTTRYACANARRIAMRREARELRVAQQQRRADANIMQNEIDHHDEREHLLPLLDDAMTQLGERDRSGVILAFFQQRTFREIGALLGTSEDAARKRVSRSIDRMREYFASRGVSEIATSSFSAAVLVHEASQLAPATLVSATTKLATLSHLAMLTVPSAQIAQKVMHTMLMWKVKLAAAACAAIVTGTAVTATALHHLNEPNDRPTVVASGPVMLSTSGDSFEAKVSDETLVQFAGIAKFGATGDEWFGIDGQKVDDPRGPWVGQQLNTEPGRTHMAMILVTAHGQHGASTRIRMPTAKASDNMVLTNDDIHAYWLIPFSMAPGATSTEIHVLIAEGEWKTIVSADQTQVGRPLGGYNTDFGGIAFTHISENPRQPGGSVVYVAHDIKETQFNVFAVDTQGNERSCDNIYSDDIGGFKTVRYEYSVAPDQIKSLVAKVRPFTKRVVAKNLTLDPANPQKPTIEVSPIEQKK
jgi:RNA polymerase sigma factor (sigma-70 family)